MPLILRIGNPITALERGREHRPEHRHTEEDDRRTETDVDEPGAAEQPGAEQQGADQRDDQAEDDPDA